MPTLGNIQCYRTRLNVYLNRYPSNEEEARRARAITIASTTKH